MSKWKPTEIYIKMPYYTVIEPITSETKRPFILFLNKFINKAWRSAAKDKLKCGNQ